MDPSGRTIVVTGGASGLGNATARRLHAAGARVVLVDLSGSRGQEEAEDLGERALFAAADVTDAGEVGSALDAAEDRFGGIHAVVSCAGTVWAERTVAPAGPHDLDGFRRTVEVNLVGTFNVLRLAAARMAANEPDQEGERGVVVNTASVAAFEGQIGQVAYAAAKGGIVGLTLPAARDLAVQQTRVVTIAPGVFDTPMLASLSDKAREGLHGSVLHPHRLGSPDEYAALVEHVIRNPYVNGTTIRLDGGLRLPPG